MRKAPIFLFVILVVALCPYLVTCFYALPFADDFCFGWTSSQNISFLQKFLHQYLHWNGRYTSDILVSLHPLATGSLWLYQWVCLLSVIVTPFILFILARSWIEHTFTAVLMALFFTLFYLSYLPDITEGVYWYIGLVNYHWGALCFILQLVLLNQLCVAKRYAGAIALASFFLLILSIGFNEVAAAVIPVYYLAAFVYFKWGKAVPANKNEFERVLLAHFLVAFLASAFVVFSPGNFTRADAFPERFRLVHSLFYASLQTARFIGRWAISVPFVALSLIVAAKAGDLRNEWLKKTDYRVLLLMAVFTVFMAAFLPYMATGILGQHRTMNYVFPFFILLSFASVLSFSYQYGWHIRLKHVGTPANVLILALIASTGLFFQGSGLSVIQDMKRGYFQQYRCEFMQRQSVIIKNTDAPIPSLKQVPNTFQIVDVKRDTGYWADKCMKRFYSETKLVLH